MRHIIEDGLLQMEASMPVTPAEFVTIWDKDVNIDCQFIGRSCNVTVNLFRAITTFNSMKWEYLYMGVTFEIQVIKYLDSLIWTNQKQFLSHKNDIMLPPNKICRLGGKWNKLDCVISIHAYTLNLLNMPHMCVCACCIQMEKLNTYIYKKITKTFMIYLS